MHKVSQLPTRAMIGGARRTKDEELIESTGGVSTKDLLKV